MKNKEKKKACRHVHTVHAAYRQQKQRKYRGKIYWKILPGHLEYSFSSPSFTHLKIYFLAYPVCAGNVTISVNVLLLVSKFVWS